MVYSSLTIDDVDEICQKHLMKGKVVTHLTLSDITPEEEQKIIEYQEANFHIKQERRVLKNTGCVKQHKRIHCSHGYFGLYKALMK